jgi:2-dehydropantoate 2-reductase
MKVAVIGAGAIGGYFGSLLAGSGTAVHLLARGANLEALRRGGIRIRSVLGNFEVPTRSGQLHVHADPREVGPTDVVLFCVKSYDTESAAAGLEPLLGTDTAVISLQNGIDNEEKLAAAIGAEHVVGGVAFIFARLAAPGTVVHTGGPRRLVIGELDGRPSPRTEAFVAACRAAVFPADVSADIRVTLWSKYAFICAQAGVTAATRLPIGIIRDMPETFALFRSVVAEAWSVGRAEGVPLPDDLVEQQLAFARGLEPDGRSSLADDLVAGRRMELDALLGELVRRGQRSEVATPASAALLAVLRPWQLRNAASTTAAADGGSP